MSTVLQKYFNPSAIKLAFFRVQCWPDKLIKDQVGLRAFGKNLDDNCKMLSDKMLSAAYNPQRGFKFYVPKASKTTRTKTLLFVEDSLIYQAIANTIGANNYDTLNEQEGFVFGSVLAPEVKHGLSILEQAQPNFFFYKFWKNLFNKFKESVIHSIEVDKVKYKFETDITGFFDCIPHYNLLVKLSENFGVEDEILDLLSKCFNTWSGTKESLTPGVGIPQSCVPSFLFANMILHDLDDLIIAEGFKYYRYMDDIKIYAYEEKELVKALVLIDKYLKGNGLSINSKKTSIEEIIEGTEDATVKEMKKVDTFSYYDIPEGVTALPNWLSGDIPLDDSVELESISESNVEAISKDDKMNASNLSDQDQNQDHFDFGEVEVLTEEADIIEFWEKNLLEVEKSLPALFIDESVQIDLLTVTDDIVDIDFIKLSAQYGTSFRKLRELKPDLLPNKSLLKYWLFVYRKYFWRANLFGLTISLYKNEVSVKAYFLDLLKTDFEMYEWNRYYAVFTLSFSHTFEDKELRQSFFKILLSENSDLVKIALYRLLFKHAKNDQFLNTLRRQLQKEPNHYVKLLIADFNKNHNSGNLDIVQFINSIGL